MKVKVNLSKLPSENTSNTLLIGHCSGNYGVIAQTFKTDEVIRIICHHAPVSAQKNGWKQGLTFDYLPETWVDFEGSITLSN